MRLPMVYRIDPETDRIYIEEFRRAPIGLHRTKGFWIAGSPQPDGTVAEHFDGKIDSPTLLDAPEG
jgi:hypothetical protein